MLVPLEQSWLHVNVSLQILQSLYVLLVRVYLSVKTCDFFLCFLPLSCTLLFHYLLFSLFYVTCELAGFYTEDEPLFKGWRLILF